MTQLPRPDAKPWHTESADAVLTAWQTPQAGLSEAEAGRRHQLFGPNLLPEQGATPLWRIVLRQFASPLIYILVIAAVVSIAIGDLKDAGFIAAVLAINAVIGAYQEWRAEQSSQALRKLLRIHAAVMRDGEIREITADAIVPGDIVWLESGNRVPADIRLLETQNLEIDESLLTGESLAVHKDADSLAAAETTLGDRHNMGYAASIVARGRGKGVVIATGASTTVGQLAQDVIGAAGGKPPLLERMERFTNYVAVGTIVASVGIGLLGVLLWQYSLQETFFLVVALAVSAIPEGLPVAMTVALAVATTRMARRNVIVRRLTAVEGLGSCTLIATDKTGTLTCNELTVREIRLGDGEVLNVTGEGFAPHGEVLSETGAVAADDNPLLRRLAAAAVLCNEADLKFSNDHWSWHGDAVDVALLSVGRKLGLERARLLEEFPEVGRIPFESEQQYSASFHEHDGKTVVFVKGAPERLLEMCRLDDGQDAKRFEEIALSMAKRGLRVLAIASGAVEGKPPAEGEAFHPQGMTLLGYVGMIDPLRSGVKEAVAACHDAGVDVTMITGDHRVTALAIARDLGLAESEDQVITAAELEEHLGNATETVRRARVFARVTPRQKLEIVEAERKAGRFVAVTGDGVNDAPALRAANIGVAMGKGGTDVAREAADLVLSDDNFASIVAGIEEGRIAYDNIRKVIYLLVSMGAAELLMVLLAVVVGLPVPLTPVQLLWLNLVTNGIQGVALAFEPGEKDVLERKPRPPGEAIFNRLMIERMLVAVPVVGVGGFLVFAIARQLGWSDDAARNLLLLTMVLFENFHIGNCRSESQSAFALSPLKSPVLFFGALGAFLLHVASMYLPFMQTILRTEPIDLGAWGVAVGVAILVVPAVELHKLWWNRRAERNP